VWRHRYNLFLFNFLLPLMYIVYCCIVDPCLRRSASAVSIDCIQLRRHRWNHHQLALTSSHQVAAQCRSLTTPFVWKSWSHWCQKSASIISGPKRETFPGWFVFLCRCILNKTKVLLTVVAHVVFTKTLYDAVLKNVWNNFLSWCSTIKCGAGH